MSQSFPAQVPAELVTVRDWVRWCATRMNQAGLYFGHGTADAPGEAAALVAHVLDLGPALEPEFMDARLTAQEAQATAELLAARVDSRRPLAYLTGLAWFAGHPFHVDERVLVPRSPIAELIEGRFQPWLERAPSQVLDLCAGSGCIGIACAHAFPGAQVDLAELCPDALEVAEANTLEHGLEDRVAVIESDLFAGLAGQRYDLIVTNPPYVDGAELAAMPEEYHQEPALGLAAGVDGLDLVHRILAQAANHLSDEGVLICEVGASAPALVAAYPGLPFIWLRFRRGGEGVFLLTAQQLRTAFGGDQGP